METINKVNSIYSYPAKGKGDRATEVGFYIDSRLDKFGNVLRDIIVTNKYGENLKVPYSGKTLMISVSTSPKTTSIRRATRQDLVRFKEAYESYLSKLSLAERKEHEEKSYSILDEEPPVKEEKEKKNKE